MDNKVEKIYVGDQVFGSTGPRFGACAEYIALPASYPTIHKPRNVPHFTATTIPVIEVHALLFLRLAQPKASQEILIVGVCGCICTFAVQIAKRMGARVTAIDSAYKLYTLKPLDAGYSKVDFTHEDEQCNVIVGSSRHGAKAQWLLRLR
jgi:NADPH:quinone reductase-like Zn-dependent oxidoreductase